MSHRIIHLGWLMALSLLFAAVFTLLPLPDWLAFARPALLPLMTLYWALLLPRRFGLVACWSMGLLLDVLGDAPLGQHALALTVCSFFVLYFSEFIRSYRVWQQTLLFLPIFLLYEFILFWLDGIAGRSADPLWRWAPALSTAACWPLVTRLFRRLLRHARYV